MTHGGRENLALEPNSTFASRAKPAPFFDNNRLEVFYVGR